VYLYHRVHFLGHALAENKQRSGWQFGGRERREAGRKAHDGQHGQHEQHDVSLPVAVSVVDRKPVTGSDSHACDIHASELCAGLRVIDRRR